MKYEPTIGLEIHIQLETKSKMFCPCANDSEENRPNLNVCPVCLGHPGTLPTINEEAVKKTIKTGLALNCQIAEYSRFERKSYFYPDLAKGYQISQYEFPLCQGGFLKVNGKKIRIRRIHLEEDTGRLVHPKGADYSLVDFNRAGVPLMELVTEPDLKSAQEARLFAQELHLILHYLKISDADMEKGQMRVEVNISLNEELRMKNKELGTKVEIKNLNSFRSVERAIQYEIERQTEVLKSGKKVIQETRGWDEKKETTISQRGKEEAHDYRYFPEPDLPPLYFDQDFINEIKSEIPELPQQKRERFKKEYGLEEKDVEVFVYNKNLSEYFEKTASELDHWVQLEELKSDKKLYKVLANYLITDALGLLDGKEFSEKVFKVTPENFAEFIKMVYQDEISSKAAKMVLAEMFSTGNDPSNIIKERGLVQVTDELEIEKIVKQVILENQKPVQDYKKGKENALQFLVGQVMKKTKGTAKPDIVQGLLKKLLR